MAQYRVNTLMYGVDLSDMHAASFTVDRTPLAEVKEMALTGTRLARNARDITKVVTTIHRVKSDGWNGKLIVTYTV